MDVLGHHLIIVMHVCHMLTSKLVHVPVRHTGQEIIATLMWVLVICAVMDVMDQGPMIVIYAPNTHTKTSTDIAFA